MIKRVVLVLAMAAMVFMPALASAALFNFNYSGTGITTIGTLTADLFAPGAYHITGISGTRNGDAITSFATGGPANFVFDAGAGQVAWLDNKLYIPTNPGYFTGSDVSQYGGFAYQTASGWFNPWFDGTRYYEFKLGTSVNGPEITFNASAVPIPAAFWLLGSGLIGLVGLRRRFKN